MKKTYLFLCVLGACLILLGSSVSLQAQDEPTSPGSTDAPIDPIDGQPPQGPNNPAPEELCGIETDKIECKWPYDFTNTQLTNLKCKLRGRCVLNALTGKHDCNDIDDPFPLVEYEGTTTLIKDIKQIVEAPYAPEKKLYEKTEKVCYKIYDCESECERKTYGWYCKRKSDPKDKKTYFEYKWKGDCPPIPNPNP